MRFSGRDRFEKFFLGAILIMATAIDRHYFSIYNMGPRYRREEQKLEELETGSRLYVNRRQEYLEHHHSLRVVFRHNYSTRMS